tara:strand:+ start:923 stop:1186 length:264 start_codon:yes stop_codon:yes gene_type:complete
MGSARVMVEGCDPIAAEDKGLPNNTYLATYFDEEGNKKHDIVQGTQVDIFDMYYDKYKNLQSLDWTAGTINPKLYGYKPTEDKKKKR